ncbi:MAG: hypothetical protein IT261_08390 [Saprospiraceae bacterium]|nr:hypothetical protein [Saprospiraceae bacterium]
MVQVAQAQVLGTDDDGFVVQITSPASIAQSLVHGADPGVCQWIGQTEWGADVTQELCGEVVWADDSIGCSQLTNASALAGKIALIRRGTCGFSVKVSWAAKAGAKAAIILNHYANAQDGPCTTYANATQFLGGMSGLDSTSTATIPAIFLERATGEAIDGALAAGETVTVCFSFPRLTGATSASMYATPLSQVDTMQAITVNYNNRSGATQTDVNIKAEVFNPSGALIGTLNYNMPVCEPGVDSFIVFPSFYAPPALGKHTVRFTNDKYTESIDTVFSYFEHTNYTFATDNLVVDPSGVGPDDATFALAGFTMQNGGLVLTGDAPSRATYATFGVTNAADIVVPGEPSANIVGVAVYKADVDGDGAGDLSTSFVDDLGAGLISYVEYEMTGNEVAGDLIHVPLTDLSSGQDGIDLEPNIGYYVAILYDGTEAGIGTSIRLLGSAEVNYASFNTYPTTPVIIDQLYGGWTGAEIVQRLQLEGFNPDSKTAEPKALADSKINITPNPANDYINLELKLDAVNPSVAVSLVNGKGRLVNGSQVERNFQNGVMRLDVTNVPSGVYHLWIRSSEGSTMKPVVIAH